MAEKLTPSQIGERLAALHDWKVDEKGELTRTFKQPNFIAGLLFVNRIGGAAEAAFARDRDEVGELVDHAGSVMPGAASNSLVRCDRLG